MDCGRGASSTRKKSEFLDRDRRAQSVTCSYHTHRCILIGGLIVWVVLSLLRQRGAISWVVVILACTILFNWYEVLI